MESNQLYLIHRNKYREAAKNMETKKQRPNEGTDQNCRKKLNKMERSNLSESEFKTLVIRMLQKLSEDLNIIKKAQSETKDTLSDVKKNLQANNSRVDEAKNHINDLEHKEEKKQLIIITKRKKN